MRPPRPVDRKVRRTLSEATSGIHERLHRAAPFGAIAAKRLDLDGYRKLLGKIAAFHFAVGPALKLSAARRGLLSQDLDAVDGASPPPIRWDPPETPAGRLGCAYVVEGSTLGGKILFRQLDYLFGAATLGRSFFRGTPADGARWGALCVALETHGQEPEALDAMIAGARDTFALFERLIEPVPAHG